MILFLPGMKWNMFADNADYYNILKHRAEKKHQKTTRFVKSSRLVPTFNWDVFAI
jgi:hypothetical protein